MKRALVGGMVFLSGAASAGCAHSAHHGGHGEGHAGGHGHGEGHAHRFDDPARWATIFDDPARDAWQRPDEVIRMLSLRGDERVADLGAGTGYFSVRLARAVPRGRVWALDVEPAMVGYLAARAQRESLDNLFGVLCTPDDALLPEPVDVVLVVDTHHHIEHRVAYYTRLHARLRPGGRVVIVDYTRESPMGPPAEMRLSPDAVRDELTHAGFTFDASPAGLPNQYVLIFRRDA